MLQLIEGSLLWTKTLTSGVLRQFYHRNVNVLITLNHIISCIVQNIIVCAHILFKHIRIYIFQANVMKSREKRGYRISGKDHCCSSSTEYECTIQDFEEYCISLENIFGTDYY